MTTIQPEITSPGVQTHSRLLGRLPTVGLSAGKAGQLCVDRLNPPFNLERYLIDRQTFKERRSATLAEWRSLAG